MWKFNSDQFNNQKSGKILEPILFSMMEFCIFYHQILLLMPYILKQVSLPGKKFTSYPGPRGYLINQEDNESYLYITSDRRLFKINSKTGKLDKKFGLNGSIDVGFIQSAPVVYKDQIMLLETDKKQILSYHLKMEN